MKLEWDSRLFGINIARIEFTSREQFDYEVIKMKNSGINLVYCFCKSKNEHVSKFGQLVDEKITFVKTFDKPLDDIYSQLGGIILEEYKEVEPTEKLYNLSIQSGVYSRFNIDPKIPTSKFESLYRTWIQNSTNKKIAYKVIVAKNKDEIIGMITLGGKNYRGDIGLIVVDGNSRCMGIATAMMYIAEKDFREKFDVVQVVTQKNNIPACKLYEKSGFSIEKIEPIYHIWL